MLRLLLPLPALAACAPSPEKVVMPSPMSEQATRAAQTPNPEPVSKPVPGGAIPAPGPLADAPAAALGRRTLSTAFVRVGPDGYLTVELRDGRVLALRDVTMGPREYCGAQGSGKRYCGGYADVAAARPGGAPAAEPPHDQDQPAAGPGASGARPDR